MNLIYITPAVHKVSDTLLSNFALELEFAQSCNPLSV